MNYETVKAFTNEKLEDRKYSGILKRVQESVFHVQ